jgi:hypothetical protein
MKMTFLWFTKQKLKEQTESGRPATQDQALNTRCYVTKILKTMDDTVCRMCQQSDQTVKHLSKGYPGIGREEHIPVVFILIMLARNTLKNEIKMLLSWFSGTTSTGRRNNQIHCLLPPFTQSWAC